MVTRPFLIFLLAALTLLAGPAAAAERILDFRSQVLINGDSTVQVTETITVRSEGKQIKRGIYRDFPTDYKDRAGNRVRVRFSVTQVLRDGRPEPYFIKARSNGQRVYMGEKDVFLKPGVHTYALTYITDRQIGFFDDYDEFYWNVTGNGWAFPIDRAAAVVQLPPGTQVMERAAYTGRQGARGGDYTFTTAARGRSVFTTTRTLAPGEGLTIAIAWPKGFVRESGAGDKAASFARDNLSAPAALVGFILVVGYYLFAWIRVGRDMPAGTIVPLFEPPEGFSPAATRFVTQMKFDNKAFAAAVIDMAVKGYLTIEEEDGEFTLRKAGGETSPALSKGERKLAATLFGNNDAITLKNKNHKRIKKAIKALENSLAAEFEKVLFVTNKKYLVPGIASTAVILLALVAASPEPAISGFMTIWLSIWLAACVGLGFNVVQSWRAVFSGTTRSTPLQWPSGFGGGGASMMKAPIITLISLPFFVGLVVGAGFLSQQITMAATLLMLATVAASPIFHHLLKAPTLRGRRVMDRIDGFRMFLSVAEKDRLNILHPPETTPELFEKYLPYALAMDVEHQWSEAFAQHLNRAGLDTTSHHPRWYRGPSWSHHGVSGFTSNLGSAFANAISASSTAPGSSSGSGGGGFSGGGGGGGGGGGW